jgi:hypothetical protein
MIELPPPVDSREFRKGDHVKMLFGSGRIGEVLRMDAISRCVQWPDEDCFLWTPRTHLILLLDEGDDRIPQPPLKAEEAKNG